MSQRASLFIVLVVATLAVLAGALSARYLSRPAAPEQALALETRRPLPAFTLVDHTGRTFDPTRLRGRWTLVFFGFTHCPDICPTTLNTLAGVRIALAELPPETRPEIVMVSVDPMRDTPEQLASYVPYFDPEFLGVTGDMAEILTLTRSLGVAFSYTPVADSEAYGVDHTASLFLVDPQARLAAIFSTPHAVADIARDYRRIVAEPT
jgi:protein SCO1/2